MEYEPVIGLEVHAELQTRSKMFCSCPVVDNTQSTPNMAVCPVCMGMPGVLPVVNQQAVEMGMRVALALGCTVANTSIFDRKNYFYPDLPKGYQISQYEFPLAEQGLLPIFTSQGERSIRVRRVHLEEDTGKLTHLEKDGQHYSLVDLNRAGIPLLEIVSEPDMFSIEEAKAYAVGLHSLVRYLGVNSGDMSKGVIRFEANVSIRPKGSRELGTRVEIKNLNSFRAMERAIAYQLEQQAAKLDRGERIEQETLGWDEAKGVTFSQRSKEEAHDYRYFPEPDLPPLVVETEWIERVRRLLPELPYNKVQRYCKEFNLSARDAHTLVYEPAIADYFEASVRAAVNVAPATLANWIMGSVFAWMNIKGTSFDQVKATPQMLADLVLQVQKGVINLNTAKTVCEEMLETGRTASQIIQAGGLQQVSDRSAMIDLVNKVLQDNPNELDAFLKGKESLANWFFGQAMRLARGQADPQVLREELNRRLETAKSK